MAWSRLVEGHASFMSANSPDRVLGLMDGLLTVFLMREGDILQPIENDKSAHFSSPKATNAFISRKFSN